VSEPRLRSAARALVLDDDDRVLLVCHGTGASAIWVTPGGGVEEDETDVECMHRELLEETGLESFVLGPHVWSRTAHMPLGDGRWDGEVERVYLVRTQAFEPAPAQPWEALRADGMTDIRWWTLPELEAAETRFAPRRLPQLLRELILHGPPAEPVDVGL
jgi:8-oxo-dGTP pyrophosphatase MutT (NUDIX family)